MVRADGFHRFASRTGATTPAVAREAKARRHRHGATVVQRERIRQYVSGNPRVFVIDTLVLRPRGYWLTD